MGTLRHAPPLHPLQRPLTGAAQLDAQVSGRQLRQARHLRQVQGDAVQSLVGGPRDAWEASRRGAAGVERALQHLSSHMLSPAQLLAAPSSPRALT